MKKKKFVTDESKLVSTYFDRPHRECEGACIEFRTCKGDDCGSWMDEHRFFWQCPDCEYREYK